MARREKPAASEGAASLGDSREVARVAALHQVLDQAGEIRGRRVRPLGLLRVGEQVDEARADSARAEVLLDRDAIGLELQVVAPGAAAAGALVVDDVDAAVRVL